MTEETPPAPPKSARHVWQFAKRNWFLIILMGFMAFSLGRVAIDLFPVPQTVTLTCLSQHSSFSPAQTFTVRIDYSLPITRLGLAKEIREQVTAKARG